MCTFSIAIWPQASWDSWCPGWLWQWCHPTRPLPPYTWVLLQFDIDATWWCAQLKLDRHVGGLMAARAWIFMKPWNYHLFAPSRIMFVLQAIWTLESKLRMLMGRNRWSLATLTGPQDAEPSLQFGLPHRVRNAGTYWIKESSDSLRPCCSIWLPARWRLPNVPTNGKFCFSACQ